ncbi:MAG TPA: Na/Pi cotransporter family protein [Hyphomicrobiaceae bacterium]|nr:Na/Pi cotransporter family protein [Hyphomicrobiaceae bacterium]
MQSSAGVTLLAAGFAGTSLIPFTSAVAVVLGADMGSALLVQFFSQPLDWLVPVLLTVGAGIFIKTEQRRFRQAGRIILGIAFVLISLQFLRETMNPIREANFLPSIALYLKRDFVTAFIVGAALTWLLHSSVAMVLMCVTLVSVGTFPIDVGVAIVLGANLGSAIVPVWLSRTMPNQARRVPTAALVLRGGWSVVSLLGLSIIPIQFEALNFTAGQTLVIVHMAFNFAMLFFLPFLGLVEKMMLAIMPDQSIESENPESENKSVLDPTLLDRPKLAITCVRREVLRMQEMTGKMFAQVQQVYATGNKAHGRAIIQQDKDVNDALDGIRRYAARIAVRDGAQEDADRLRELVEYAIAVESAADVVTKRLIPRALQKAAEGIELSKEGAGEIARVHENILRNLPLASNVLIADDPESARLLLEGKDEIARLERESRKNHLYRLNQGSAQTFESSNMHLETLKALKDFNSLIANVAYPIMQRSGQLLETRLTTKL